VGHFGRKSSGVRAVRVGEDGWSDMAGLGRAPGEGATAAQIGDRAAIPLRSVNRVLKDKLVPNRLVAASASRPSKRRPSLAYRLNLDGPLLDDIAESFGLLDWQERTAERYERERGGYRELQRQREQRDLEQHEAEWKPAEDGWWIRRPVRFAWKHQSLGAAISTMTAGIRDYGFPHVGTSKQPATGPRARSAASG
jgi:hypothetical protein